MASGNSNLPGPRLVALAAKAGNAQLVARLLGEGRDVNEADETGWTALLYAAFRGRADVFKVALIVHLSLRTAPLQRLVLFDRTPSLAYAPPAHLRTLRRAESRCSRAPEYTAPCRESLLADRAASAAVSRVAVRASTRHPCGPC